ncbi:DDB1- and CUL4-associated factor [Acrasis kona]|uniref:DDB1- and CUL4-associated factor n=1 Tax=Acrasis kona TaxID=1008807 RepID=A0AAW2YYL4_9EUKA
MNKSTRPKQKKRRANRLERAQSASRTAEATLNAIRTTTSGQTNIPQLPGHYYDHEQKRYFRIDHTSSFFQQHVAKEATNKQEQQKTKFEDRGSIISHLQKRMLGRVDESTFRSDFAFSRLRKCLTFFSDELKTIMPQNVYSRNISIGNLKSIKFSNPCFDYFVGHNKNQIDLHQFEFNNQKNTSRIVLLHQVFCRSDVTSIQVLPHQNQNHSYVLSSHMGGANSHGDLCLTKISPTPQAPYTHQSIYTCLKKEIWTSALCGDGSGVVSAGITGGGFIFDLSSQKVIIGINSFKSDVLCQSFDESDSNLLWCGRRDGMMSLYDPRTVGSNRHLDPCVSFSTCFVKSPINNILQLKNYGSVVVGNMNGELSLFDIRFIRSTSSKKSIVRMNAVASYQGHLNGVSQHVNISKDPMVGRYLMAGGCDGLLRIWDIHRGGPSLAQIVTSEQITDFLWMDQVGLLGSNTSKAYTVVM